MIILWTSIDGYVVVADDLAWPAGDAPNERSDLETLFRRGAWILVWRSGGDDRWYFARSRRTSKPSLSALRYAMREHGDETAAIQLWIAPNDAHGHVYAECDADAIAIGEAIYAAWGRVAADALPAKLAFLKIDPDDYDPARVNAWLRPGIPTHRERRRAIREVLEEVA